MSNIILTQPTSSGFTTTSQYATDGNLNTSLDAFGRTRVSDPFTIFDSAFRYDDDPTSFDTQVTGTGTATHLPNESSVEMSVSAANDAVIRETKQVFMYQPGKSMLTLCSFAMNQPSVGLTQRVGLFGTQNGIFFETNGTDLYIVKRSYVSGTTVDTKISQTEWNVDTMDGSGPSGVGLDITKAQLFWVDVEWLGVGSVRTGFVINGQFVVCHIFHHANQIDTVYMTTATLPIRYEITTSTTQSASMKHICSTVMSEGGYVNTSLTRAVGTPLTGKALSQTVYTPLVAIRLKSNRLDSVVVPSKIDVYGLQQAAFKYQLLINPTLTGASFASVASDSAVEYDISATALSGGRVIDEGIFVGSNKGGAIAISEGTSFSQQLGRFLNGTSDVFVLAAISTTNNDQAVGTISWQEHM